MRELVRVYLVPRRRALAGLGLLLVVGLAAEIGSPLLIGYFIDAAVVGAAESHLVAIAVATIILATVQQAASVLRVFVSEGVAWSATNDLRRDLADHALRLDERFHANHTPGDLVERVDGDSGELGNFFSNFILVVITNLLFVGGVLVVVAVVDWRLGLAVLAFIIGAGILFTAIRNIAVGHWKEARQASADLYGFTEERIGGLEGIKPNGGAVHVRGQLDGYMGGLLTSFRRARVRGNRIFIVTGCAVALGEAGVVGLGAVLLLRGDLSIGILFAVYFYMQLLQRPIDQLSRQLQDLQRASASISRIGYLFSQMPEPPAGDNFAVRAESPTVRFRNVTFSYTDTGDPALRNVSFDVPSAMVLGLLGPTGSGKTTITRLLTRVHESYRGKILLDDTPVDRINLASLRGSVVATVSQAVDILPATLRDNVTLFRPDVSDERLHEVFDELCLTEWFQRLPDGLDTWLGTVGEGLSAGEAQLVNVARVFLRNPGVVVLDEASSRLDPVTERLLQSAVNTLLAGRTGIVVAHRLATAMRSDLVLLLDNGSVAEMGPPSDLAARPDSRLSALLRTNEVEEILA